MISKYKYEMGGIIRDTELDMPYYTDDIVDLLDEKDQKIAELEKTLEWACGKLVDFEAENKESMHSAQYWFDYLKARAKQELKIKKAGKNEE